MQPIGNTTLDVDPGKHALEASAPGHEPLNLVLKLKEGETRSIEIILKPTTPEDPDNDGHIEASGPAFAVGPVTWTGVAMTGVGLITGIAAGAITLSRASTLKDQEQRNEAKQADINAAMDISYISDAGFALAGVGAITGLLGFFLIDPSRSGGRGEGAKDTAGNVSSLPTLTPLLGPGYIGLQGAF